jgi:hypothetical protein
VARQFHHRMKCCRIINVVRIRLNVIARPPTAQRHHTSQAFARLLAERQRACAKGAARPRSTPRRDTATLDGVRSRTMTTTTTTLSEVTLTRTQSEIKATRFDENRKQTGRRYFEMRFVRRPTATRAVVHHNKPQSRSRTPRAICERHPRRSSAI